VIRRSRLTAAAVLFTCTGFLPLPIFAAPPVPTAAVAPENALADAVQKAISENTAVADAAIARLRAAGPAGLDALFAAYGTQVEAADDADPMWPRIRRAIEKTAAQRDAHVSKLFWYKDLEQAKAAAKASGKPILSLRMMGQLDEEFSCANSRFFRILLYANGDISKFLRENYILHWRSVRPVPKVTIDFGDGRKLERTITGNSIHYVLDANGRVLDALPGLYAPERFLAALQDAAYQNTELAGMPPEGRARLLRANFSTTGSRLLSEWEAEARKVGVTFSPEDASRTPVPEAKPSTEPAPVPTPEPAVAVPVNSNNVINLLSPTALSASRMATTKSIVEVGIVQLMTPREELETRTDAVAWSKIAEGYLPNVTVDESSRRLLRCKVGSACPTEAAFGNSIESFRRAIAEDTVRNEFLLRTKILARLKAAPTTPVETLNEWVYAELFLTPSSDPWLGLLPKDAVVALDGNGIVSPAAPTKPAPKPVKATVKRRAPRR
jgi:hypothetical protein